jgi:hypothetical protein
VAQGEQAFERWLRRREEWLLHSLHRSSSRH